MKILGYDRKWWQTILLGVSAAAVAFVAVAVAVLIATKGVAASFAAILGAIVFVYTLVMYWTRRKE